MKKIRAIIIEDETQAREMLHTMLTDYCDDVIVIGEAANVQEGVAIIKKLVPDLVFLDIEMPGEKGMELFKYFNQIDFEVIFTTAYDQYAINALRLSALDYLLKPIDLRELRSALEQFRNLQNEKQLNQALRYQLAAQSAPSSQKIVLRTKDCFIFLETDDIMYCIAENNYTLFLTKEGKKHLVSKPLKEYADLLETFNFIRIHRSYIINPNYVARLNRARPSSIVMKDGKMLTIAKVRRDSVIDSLTNT